MHVAREQPAGGVASSDLISVRTGALGAGFRSAFRPDLTLEAQLLNSIAVEADDDRPCMLHTLSAWEGKTLSWDGLEDLLLGFLRNRPYQRSGDGRQCFQVLNAAYGCQLTAVRGELRKCSFRDLIVAYANMSACVVVVVHDDTDGSGPRSLSRGTAMALAEHAKDKRVNARRRASLSAKTGLRLAAAADSRVSVAREAVRPLRSLRGWRAFSTGSYCVALRWHHGHVQPMAYGPGARKGRRARPEEFWGNNGCALRAEIKGELDAPLRLDAPHVVEPIGEGGPDSCVGVLQRPYLLQTPDLLRVTSSDDVEVLRPTNPIACLERHAHRRKCGFRSPSACGVCGALARASERYDTLTTATLSPGGWSLTTRGSTRIRPGYTGEDATWSVTFESPGEITCRKCNIHIDRVDKRPPIIVAPQPRRDGRVKTQTRVPASVRTRRPANATAEGGEVRTLASLTSLSSLTTDTLGRVHGAPGSRWRC
jgi:hypothetical protein